MRDAHSERHTYREYVAFVERTVQRGGLMFCRCPYESAQIEGWAADPLARGLRIEELIDRLSILNMSQWWPECKTPLTLRRKGIPRNGTARATQTFSSLHTDSGEVVVTLRQRHATQSEMPRVSSTWRAPQPSNARLGMELVETDARRLMETYGERYGDRDSSEEIYLIIEVRIPRCAVMRVMPCR